MLFGDWNSQTTVVLREGGRKGEKSKDDGDDIDSCMAANLIMRGRLERRVPRSVIFISLKKRFIRPRTCSRRVQLDRIRGR